MYWKCGFMADFVIWLDKRNASSVEHQKLCACIIDWLLLQYSSWVAAVGAADMSSRCLFRAGACQVLSAHCPHQGFRMPAPLAMKGENYIAQTTNFLPLAVHIIFITSIFTLPRNILLCMLNMLHISLWLSTVINKVNGEESVVQRKGKIDP